MYTPRKDTHNAKASALYKYTSTPFQCRVRTRQHHLIPFPIQYFEYPITICCFYSYGVSVSRTPAVVAAQVHESFDFVMGRAVTALPKFVGFIDKNLKRNQPNSSPAAGGGGRDGEEGIRLKRGLLYMRGEVTADELAELGAQPSTVIPLQRDFVKGPGGEEGSESGGEGGARDRGYSSVFHFTSEDIWNRMPVATSSSAGEQD